MFLPPGRLGLRRSRRHPVDEYLLPDSHDVRGHIIEIQAGREPEKKEAEGDRHNHHHALLSGIDRGHRRHPLNDKRGEDE